MAKKPYSCTIAHKPVMLVQYLTPNQHGIPGQFRFRDPEDGKQKRLENFLDIDNVVCMPAEDANGYALALLKKHYNIDPAKPKRTVNDDRSIVCLFDAWKVKRLELKPSLKDNKNFKKQVSEARRALEVIDHTPIDKITYDQLCDALHSLKHSQQLKARGALKLFWATDVYNYDKAPKIKGNPFKEDAENAFEYGDTPPLLRMSMDMEDIRLVLKSVNDAHGTHRQVKRKNKDEYYDGSIIDTRWLKMAIELSYLTALRKDDILSLTFDNYNRRAGTMFTEVKKHKEKFGDLAETFIYTVEKNPRVMELVEEAWQNRAVEIADGVTEISNFLISTRPVSVPKIMPECKVQHSQVTPDHLGKQFAIYRNMNEEILAKPLAFEEKHGIPKEPCTYHKIRGLSLRQNIANGATEEETQEAAMHRSLETTKGHYLEAQSNTPVLKNSVSDLY